MNPLQSDHLYAHPIRCRPWLLQLTSFLQWTLFLQRVNDHFHHLFELLNQCAISIWLDVAVGVSGKSSCYVARRNNHLCHSCVHHLCVVVHGFFVCPFSSLLTKEKENPKVFYNHILSTQRKGQENKQIHTFKWNWGRTISTSLSIHFIAKSTSGCRWWCFLCF